MTRPSFSLFQSHLDLAHGYWKRHLKKGDTVLDATCGHGHDSLMIAQTILGETEGALYCLDLQEIAIESTKQRLKEVLIPSLFERIFFFQQSHETFPAMVPLCNLIVYNLGYLPKGDKCKTTQRASTLNSIKNALFLVKQGGLISVTCYSGHPEGAEEKTALLGYVSTLSPQEYLVFHHQIENRRAAPSLLLIFKRN